MMTANVTLQCPRCGHREVWDVQEIREYVPGSGKCHSCGAALCVRYIHGDIKH